MGEPEGVKGYGCPKCNWSDFSETKICPRCYSVMNEVSFFGRGKIATFTVIRYPPSGFENQAPYVVGLIDLDNGPRVMARINANPDGLLIGQIVNYVGTVDGALRFKP